MRKRLATESMEVTSESMGESLRKDVQLLDTAFYSSESEPFRSWLGYLWRSSFCRDDPRRVTLQTSNFKSMLCSPGICKSFCCEALLRVVLQGTEGRTYEAFFDQWDKMYVPRAIISLGSAAMLVQNSLPMPVSLMQILIDHLRNSLVHLAKHLVALGRLIVLEVASLPECIAGLAERLGLQTELGLHGAHHMASVAGALAQDAPHVLHVHGPS